MTDSARTPDAAPQGVTLSDFSLRAGRLTLLDHVNVTFPAGKVSLVIGASGVGKTLLLRTLVGLVKTDEGEIAASGQVRIGEREVLDVGPGVGLVGVVFQNFALLDELSPLDNLRFAAAHRPVRSRHAPPVEPRQLLADLGVPLNVRTASLSGGQRQRLAIARTLAYDPAVILFDEPTSGLDGGMARQVAELIASTHAQHGKTTIIVTHDVQVLAPIADHIFVLDPTTHSLREVERAECLSGSCVLPRLSYDINSGDVPQSVETFSVVSGVRNLLTNTSRVVEQVALLPWRMVPRWTSPPWGVRFLLHYLRLVAGPSAWVYVAVAGAIAGFVTTDYTFRFLPYRSYIEPLLEENLLDAVGFTLYRILVPVLISSMVAARCGAAVASDVGAKVYGHQFDALRSLGARPETYIGTNILWAFLVGIVGLNLIAFIAARAVSLVVFAVTHTELGPFFWQAHFEAHLRVPGQWWYQGTGWLVLKLLMCGAGIASISYQLGARPKHSPADVSRGITSTVLWSTLLVLLVHMLFALFEFNKPPGS
jgi:ABC-type polar amino acid transport system ATPase subunit/ABC-type transporter Mla maintaining outer membrane lipid asymmetry permease subunit MlaE